MNTSLKILVLITAVVLPLLFWSNIKEVFSSAKAASSEQSEKGDKKSKKQKEDKEDKKPAKVSPELKVVDKWELPDILTEISGLEYLGENRFACIQDELGTIYIYNTAQNKVEKEIPFAVPGDYEGIAIVGTTAYIVRSDGRLFEVNGYNGTKRAVKEYTTHLTDHNVEGLCYDKKNNRLLVAIKDKEPKGDYYKGIYAFDLAAKKMAVQPALRIDLSDPVFRTLQELKLKDVMKPSELEIHPISGDIYITEGASPKLLIMDANGNKKKLYQMSSSEFQQAEGITFNPKGELFISNEGKKGAANILKVEITDIP